MSVYSEKIIEAVLNAGNSRPVDKADADGKAVNLSCASFVKIELSIGSDSGTIEDAGFSSNGCGYMIAAAEHILSGVKGKKLTQLKGVEDEQLRREFVEFAGEIPPERQGCFAAAAEALHKALAKYRRNVIEEFSGEKALICTCFGVTEDRIIELIEQNAITETGQISALTNAGTGCGSCLMLIEDIISSGN